MPIRTTEIVDQNVDTSRAFIRKLASLLADKDFGDTVWSIANDFSEERSMSKQASSDKFAYPEARLFPVNTENDTILSKVYFEGQRTKIAEDVATKINARLNTYLDLYGVPDSFSMLAEKVAEKQDFKPRHLMPSAGMFKVATVEDINLAYEAFSTNLGAFSLSGRVEFCKEFAKLATTIRSQELPAVVQRYCGVMDSDLDNVKSLLHIRKTAAVRAGKNGQEYEKLAKSLDDVHTPSKEELEKLACVIHDIDESYGFTHPRYDRRMPDAYTLVFNKEASTVEEKEREEDDAKSMTKAEIIARFGDSALDALETEDGSIDTDKLQALVKAHKPEDK